MAQIFRPSSNINSRMLPVVVVVLFLGFWAVVYGVYRSPYFTRATVPVEQEVPFSHQHHVGGLGIDCRYCHTTVETSSFAGIPPTETCMTCHSQVWKDAPMLSPVRDSWTTGRPLRWNRVTTLPAFVFFDHSVHIHNGIGCSTCHGQVQSMPLTWRVSAMWMDWCVDCHTDPKPHLRPSSEIFNMSWRPGPDQAELGEKLMRQYHIDTTKLNDCSICHR